MAVTGHDEIDEAATDEAWAVKVGAMYAPALTSLGGAAVHAAAQGVWDEELDAAIRQTWWPPRRGEDGVYSWHWTRVRDLGTVALHALRLAVRALDQPPAWSDDLDRAAGHLRSIMRGRPVPGGMDALTLGRMIQRTPPGEEPWGGLGRQASRALVDTADPEKGSAVQVAVLARALLPVIAHDVDADRIWAGAWWATHGPHLARTLDLPRAKPGRAWSQEDRAARTRQRDIAIGLYNSHAYTKAAIARHLGVTRTTLDPWIKDAHKSM